MLLFKIDNILYYWKTLKKSWILISIKLLIVTMVQGRKYLQCRNEKASEKVLDTDVFS